MKFFFVIIHKKIIKKITKNSGYKIDIENDNE